MHARKSIRVVGATMLGVDRAGNLVLLGRDLVFPQVTERYSQRYTELGFDERLVREALLDERQGGLDGLAERHFPAQAALKAPRLRGREKLVLDEVHPGPGAGFPRFRWLLGPPLLLPPVTRLGRR